MEIPKNCGNAPKAVALEKDKNYAWCTCGLADVQPFCDGTHKQGSGMRSHVFQVAKEETYYICMCKQTKTPPFCDGTHNGLKE